MSISLLLLVLTLGLMASPHCIGMCGCGFARPWMDIDNRPAERGLFLLGRLSAYMALGGLAGWSNQLLQDMAVSAAPVFGALQWMLHAVVAMMGLAMLLTARSIDQWVPIQFNSQTVSKSANSSRPFKVGLAWFFMPCGVLYAALMLAYLSGSPWAGMVMLGVFALVTNANLMAAQQVRRWLRSQVSENSVMRLSGALILLGVLLSLLQHWGMLPTPEVMKSLSLCF